MSVIVVVRVPGDPSDLENYAAGPGGDVMRRISEAGRAAGAIRHTFAGGANEVMIIDEWPDGESFEKFFGGNPEIGDVMRDAGAQGAPEVSVYRKLSTPDQF